MLRSVGGSGRVGVIDIGSNSIRLVIYDGIGRSPLALFNEKTMCALGRGLSETGRLNPDGIKLAMDSLARFSALAATIGVGRLDCIATAAVRDAEDGKRFVAAAERRCGLSIQIVPGEREGLLSALGVLAGIPQADGVMGDLGGGSAELVALEGGKPGAAVSLPIGPLRLMELADNEKKLRDAIDQSIAGAPQTRAGRGRDFYLVGGAWRTLARIHMEHTGYPLHVIQHYAVGRGEIESFLALIGRLSRKSLEKIPGVSKKRLEVVPLASLILARLVKAIEPRRVVFSAYGLREGHLFDLLPEEERRRDPLLVACARIAERRRRFGLTADELMNWAAPLFREDGRTRLRRAAALLSDTSWAEHPDYRAEEAFLRALRLPFGGLDHPERVWLATAVHARYGGAPDAPVAQTTRRLLAEDDTAAARAWGLALRLGYTLSAGAPGLLARSELGAEDGAVTLRVSGGQAIFAGETVQRRLEALGRALGRRAQLTRENPPPPVRGAARG